MSVRKSCFTVFLAALTVLAALPLHSSPVPLTARQLAAGSPHVVVAVVEDARSLWNAQRTLIVTEYDLRIEDRLKGDAPERLTLTVPGGTVGEERHLTSVSTFLEKGTRYLLFLEDFDRPTLSPVTGAWQGVYAESGVSGSGAGFGDTLTAARELLAEVEAHPKVSDTAWRARRAEDPTLPAKTWDSRSAKFVVLDPATVPIAWNLIQPGQRFFHVDWDMMAYWNVYAELFTATNRPSPTWAFGNGVFDVAGFPTNEQLQQQVGAGWNSGTASTTFLRIVSNRTVEADLAFNPAFQWTLDDNEATQPGGPFSFRHLMLGGLGFAWGYQGLLDPTKPNQAPIAVDSVMGFGPSAYNLSTLLAEDSKAARSTYPALAKTLLDGLISSYSLKASASELTYVPVQSGAASVRAGKGFKLLNPVKIENPGTEALSNPSVKVYLVPQRFSMDGAIPLKTFRVRGKIDSGETKTLALSQVKVPASVPAGSYYLAFELVVTGDAYPANNRAWSNHDVKITVTRR